MAWISSFLLTFPTLFLILASDSNLVDFTSCAIAFNGRVWFIAYTSVVSFFLPVFVASVYYARVYAAAKRALRAKVEMAAKALRNEEERRKV